MIPPLPDAYPGRRRPLFEEQLAVPELRVLDEAWEVSARRLAALAEAGASAARGVESIAVSGSLARMDSTAASDADLVVVVGSRQTGGAGRRLRDALATLGLRAPRAAGIFSSPVSAAALIDRSTLGLVDEERQVFGTRLQLLLESQPLGRVAEFERLMRGIIARYAHGGEAEDPVDPWGYLRDDVMRYFRSLKVDYRWNHTNAPGRWRLRNLKLRHSRAVSYAALLALLGESRRFGAESAAWLATALRMTPLERLAVVYAANADDGFIRVLRCYGKFLERVGEPRFRERLEIDDVPAARDRRRANRAANDLDANADELAAELTRFFLARRAEWGERFLAGLLF